MPSSFEDLLRLELQATGENQNTWGTKTNNNLELLADAIAGHVSIAVAGSGNYTLSTSNAATDEARRAFITLSGILTGNRNIIVPSTAKTYFFRRNTSGAFSITVKTATGTGVVLPSSGLAIVVCDGTETYSIAVEDFFNKTTGGDISGIVSVSVSTSTTAAAAFVVRNTGVGPAVIVSAATTAPAILVSNGGTGPAIEANWISSPILGVANADTTVAFYAGASVAAALSTGASRILVESATISANTTTGNPTGAIGIYAGGKNPVQLVSDTINGTWVASRTQLATSVTDLPAYVVDVSGGIRTPGPIIIGTAPISAPIGSAPIYGARAWILYNGVTNVIVTSQGFVSVTRNSTGNYTFTLEVTAPHSNYCVIAGTQNVANANFAVAIPSNLQTQTSTEFTIGVIGVSTAAFVANTSALRAVVYY